MLKSILVVEQNINTRGVTQVIGERDQSRGRAAEAESRAEALGDQLAEAFARAGALVADLAMAQAASSEQRA